METTFNTDLSGRRLKTAKHARELFNRMWRKSEKRREHMAMITRQLNGGKPFSDRELRKLGQGWRTNHNFRDASAMLEQVLVAYWRMLHDVQSVVTVTIHDDSNPNKDNDERIFQQNFDRFIRDWGPDYVMQYLLFSFNHVAFGVGPVLWPDAESPKWKAQRVEDVLVAESAPASFDNLEHIGFREKLGVLDLWKKIRTTKAKEHATLAGWNVQGIREVLTRHLNETFTSESEVSEDDMMDTENKLRELSIGFDAPEDKQIVVYHTYVLDYDEKVTHNIVAEDYESKNWLFDDHDVPNRAKKIGDCASAIFFEVGNGRFYGIKGFGHKNYGTALVLNRLKSRAADATLIDGLNFKDMSDQTRDIIPITNVGPFNFLPRDVEQVQSYPTKRTTLETIALFDSNLDETNARYRDQASSIQNTDTATQANILVGIQNQVDVANATLYLTQFGQNIFEVQMKRLRANSDDKDAKLFRERCKTDGMDPKVFNNAEIEVTTGADPGTASANFRAQILQGLMAVAPTSPILEERPIIEGYILNTLGATAVRKYTTDPQNLEDVSSIQKAQVENVALGEGTPIPVWTKDKHDVHIGFHLQPLKAIVDQFEQTGAMQPDSMVALQFGIPHAEAHLENMKANPQMKAEYQRFNPEFAAIKAKADGMFNQLEKMQAAAEGEGGPGDQSREGDPNQALSGGGPGPTAQ